MRVEMTNRDRENEDFDWYDAARLMTMYPCVLL
jgi:hypothetical protein